MEHLAMIRVTKNSFL